MHRTTALVVSSWISGLLIASYMTHTTWLLILLPIWGVIYAHTQRHMLLFVCTIAFLCGFLRMQSHMQVVPLQSHRLHETLLTVQEQKTTWQQQTVVLSDQMHRKFIAKLPLYPLLSRGMEITVDADIGLWPQPLSRYQTELQRKRIIGELHNPVIINHHQTWSIVSALEQSRRYFWSQIHTSFPEPIASVVAGMLLGITGDVDDTTAEAFRRSGTSHILVISGWNITIVAALCLAVINSLKPSRLVALIVPLVIIALYVLFTGASAAVVRAGVMGSILIIGRWLDRSRSMLNIIAMAVLLITVFDPAALWDMGMQLSTLATIGLIGFATPIEKLLTRTLLQSNYLSWAREGLASTLAAQITTFPIMLCRLELPTIWSLLANTIITPVVPLAMACGTLFLLATLIHPVVAQLVAWIAYPSFAWIVTGSQVLATWPHLMHIPSFDTTPWLEICLHAGWIIGWIVWQPQNTSSLHDTPPH